MTHSPTTRAARTIAALLAATALAGCKVGPDFESPYTRTSNGWSGIDAGTNAPGVTSVPVVAPADVTEWWRHLGDPTLTWLIEKAADDNLTLAQAKTRIRQARAARDITAGGLYPSVDASASAARSRTNGRTGNLFRAGFDAAWEIDVFGGTQRAVEASEADLVSVTLDAEDVRVSLMAEVASVYLDLRGAQRQLVISKENLDAQQQTLDLTQQRFDAGYIGNLDVANARTQAMQTASQIPAFDAAAHADAFALDTLLGLQPGTLWDRLNAPAAAPNGVALPNQVPVGLPSELLMRRPDIRRAEADLHAATARIGVAVADQYPRFSLTGGLGLQGGQFSSLGTLADRFWSIGPSVSMPIFTAGRTQAQIEQAKAVADQAVLAYRQNVLVALQDVETALVNFTREQQRRAALVDTLTASKEALDTSLQLYDAGKTDFLNVLTTQGQLYRTQSALSQSETAVASDLVAIYKALGGGWEPRSTPPTSAPDARH